MGIALKQSTFFGLERFWGVSPGANLTRVPLGTMLVLRLNCSTAEITTYQKVLSD